MLTKLFLHKNYLLKATCLFWLIAKIWSYKLWIANRLFPIIPPFDFLNAVPNFVHVIFFIGSLVLLSYSIIFTNKKALIALIIVEFLSCFIDQNRWQPWQYQYLISIIVIAINFNQKQKIETWFCIICAATYFYSGLQKFNYGFLYIVWQKALAHEFLHIPTHITHHKYFLHAGLIMPILEICYGLGLLYKPTRKLVLILLTIMHLFLIAAIGPWALNVNLIVWPWNVCMIAYTVHFLLAKNYDSFKFNFLINKQNIAVAIVWCLFPLLNFVGYWDYFMSFSLYSGRIPNMEICVEKNLPKEIEYYFHLKDKPKICNGNIGVNIQTWGMDEILVPPLPQVRVYKKVKQALDKKYPNMQAIYHVYWLPKSESNYIVLK